MIVNNKEISKNQKTIIVLFLLQFFLSRIFIGTMVDTYEEMPHFGFSWLNYVIEGIIILFFMINYKKHKDVFRFILMMMLFLLAVELLQSFISLLKSSSFNAMSFISFGRIYFLILSNLIFILVFFDRDYFLKIFFLYIKITLAVSLFALLLYYTIGSSIQVYIGRGYPRIQGLLSEPSALAPILTSAVYLSLYYKRYILLVIVLVTAVVSYSSTVYLTILEVGLFLLLYNSFRTMEKTIFLFIKLILVTLSFLVIIFLLNNSSVSFMDSFSNINNIFERLSSVFVAIMDIDLEHIDYLKSLRLDRLWGFLATIRDLDNDNLLYVGYGLNGSVYVFLDRYDDIIDYGMLAFLISSFGIIVGLIIAFCVFLIMLKMLKTDYPIGIIFSSYYFGTLLNSAGGIIFYSLVFTFSLKYLYDNFTIYKRRKGLRFD